MRTFNYFARLSELQQTGVNDSGRSVLALDIPSGLNGDTGEIYDPCVRATATMTLALPKTWLVVENARTVVGDLLPADISVPALVYERIGFQVRTLFDREPIIEVSANARSRGTRARGER